MKFSTDALVLRQAPYSESSQVVHLLTAQEGRVTCLARGVHRPKSDFGGALDPMTRGEAQITRRRSSELDLLHRFPIRQPYRGFRQSLLAWTAASHVLELVRRFAWVRDRDAGLFGLVTSTLDSLEWQTDPVVVETWLASFDLHLLVRAGFRPELTLCIGCTTRIGDGAPAFSLEFGGVLCDRCAPRHRAVVRITEGALALKRRILDGHADERVTPGPDSVSEARRTLDRVMEHRIERPLVASRLFEEARSCA